MKKNLITFLFFALSFLAKTQTNSVAQKFSNGVTAKGLQEKLTILASAEMEGRETATEGQKKAAAFIENHFKKFGLKPGNGTNYQQTYDVFQDELVGEHLMVNGVSYALNTDYSFSLGTISSIQLTTNNLVFAGYGLNTKERNEYAKLNVKGKVVIVLEGLPEENFTPGLPSGRAPNNPGSNAAKATAAQSNGAVGLIIVSSEFPKKQAQASKGSMTVRKPSSDKFFILNVSYSLASNLVGRTSTLTSKEFKELNLIDYWAELKLIIDKKTNNLQSTNVIGVVEGTDKKDEYVFITGHYDHLGKRGNDIYYGADDDGSGTTAVMQLAEAFAIAKQKGNSPSRTIVFMAVSGEEKGLWGSKYYVDNPTYPLDKTTVDLNIDMIGRIDPTYKGDSLNYVFAIGEDKLSSDLQAITDSINKNYLNMQIDRRYNDPNDKNRFYFRSDHYNFAAKGVPIIFYFNGTHADYHKPTDIVEKINFPLMYKRTLLVFYTAWEMANRKDMLKRDKPLSAVGTR